jgi:hypothetical protein
MKQHVVVGVVSRPHLLPKVEELVPLTPLNSISELPFIDSERGTGGSRSGTITAPITEVQAQQICVSFRQAGLFHLDDF